jgi:hypothetical protein
MYNIYIYIYILYTIHYYTYIYIYYIYIYIFHMIKFLTKYNNSSYKINLMLIIIIYDCLSLIMVLKMLSNIFIYLKIINKVLKILLDF